MRFFGQNNEIKVKIHNKLNELLELISIESNPAKITQLVNEIVEKNNHLSALLGALEAKLMKLNGAQFNLGGLMDWKEQSNDWLTCVFFLAIPATFGAGILAFPLAKSLIAPSTFIFLAFRRFVNGQEDEKLWVELSIYLDNCTLANNISNEESQEDEELNLSYGA